MKRTLTILAVCLMVLGAKGQNILYLGAEAHIGNGKVISNSAIAVENGKFTQVANALLIRIDSAQYDTVISLKGKKVYPGFIAPNSTLGLTEIDAVRATLDVTEVGLFKPHIRSEIAYNADSDIIPTVRSNGVLTAQIVPRGGTISGTSSIMTLNGNNWEDALYKSNNGVHLNWPAMYKSMGWWSESNAVQKRANYGERVNAISSFFVKARAYTTTNEHETDLRYEAMRGLFSGTKTLFVHADYIKEILEIIQFKKDMDIEKVVLVGGYDAWMATELLVENNIAVMIKRIHSLPKRMDDDIDLPFKLPKILFDAGVLVCLQNAGDMEAMGTRNLPFYAGTAIAYGLEYNDAISMISLNTAKILGIDDRTGSLEKGKDATFFISTGDALDAKSNHLEAAFIKGEAVELGNRQSALYKKYMNRYKLPIPEKHSKN